MKPLKTSTITEGERDTLLKGVLVAVNVYRKLNCDYNKTLETLVMATGDYNGSKRLLEVVVSLVNEEKL